MAGCGSIQHQFDAAVQPPNLKITLEQINKWLTDAKLMNKKITPEDTKLCFDKYNTESIDLTTFMKFLNDLSQRKHIPPKELEEKLSTCDFLTKDQARIMQINGKFTLKDAMESVLDEGQKKDDTCKRTK